MHGKDNSRRIRVYHKRIVKRHTMTAISVLLRCLANVVWDFKYWYEKGIAPKGSERSNQNAKYEIN